MAFGKAVVWLDVTDTVLDAALVKHGTSAQTHRVRSACGWTDETLGAAILESIQELDASNARVEVMWRRDGGTSAVVQTPVTGKAAGAAAVLSLIESGSVTPAKDAVEARVLGENAEQGAHVLVSVLEQTQVDWINQAIRDAGATPGRIFVGESFAAKLAIEDERLSSGSDPVLSLVLGETVSAISIAVDGRAVLVRFAEIGMGVLREAYEQALAKAMPDTDPLARQDEAQRLLMDGVGIPAPRTDVAPGVTANDVLRVMQPALQRLTVEIKQSLRFTLDTADQPRLMFRLCGPARSIDQLERLLADQIEADCAPQSMSTNECSDWFSLAQHCGCSKWDGLSLDTSAGEGVSESGKPFWSGVAAALVLLVAVGVMTQNTTQRVASEIRSISDEIDSQRSGERSDEEIQVARALTASREFIDARYATRADLGAVLRLVAESSNDDVGLESLSAERGGESTSLRLRARATGQDANDARATLQGYISRLFSSPLTAAVDLGSVRIVEEPAQTYATFDATVTLFETVASWQGEEGE